MARHPNIDARRKILEEAIGIVYREGPRHVTMRSLAEKLGYSPATIYLHFRNKEELLKEIALHGFDALARAVEPALAIPDPTRAVADAAQRYLDFGLANPELYRLMFQDIELPMDDLEPAERERVLRAWDFNRELYARCRDAGVCSSDPEVEAMLGWSWVHGYVQLANAGRLPVVEVSPNLRVVRDAVVEGRIRALRG
jgi:AcrR family transcriptional regulator